MSQLIKKDINCKNSVVKLLASVDDISPFAEFSYDTSQDDAGDAGDANSYTKLNLNLGSCPSLLQSMPFSDKNIKVEVRLVVFTVVKPKYGKPFLEFLTHLFPDGTLSFPIFNIINGEIDDVGNNFIKNLNMPSYHIGYFVNDTYDVLQDHLSCYSVYEVDIEGITSENIMDSSLMFSSINRMWVTTNEILNKKTLDTDICDYVFDFISNIGEGISRLYMNNELVPCPRIGYIGGTLDEIDVIIEKLNEKNIYNDEVINYKKYSSNIITDSVGSNNNHNHKHKHNHKHNHKHKYKTITIGDFSFGIISTFFKISNICGNHGNHGNDINDDGDGDNTNKKAKVIDEHQTSGVILRVAFWDKPVNCIEKINIIENSNSHSSSSHSSHSSHSSTNSNNYFINYKLPKQQCYPLSVHYGRLTINDNYNMRTTNNMNLINVLKQKMYIFD